MPLGEPDWLLAYTPRPVSLLRSAFSGEWTWIAIAACWALVGLAWFLAWQDLSRRGAAGPDAPFAGRAARDSIRHANRTPDPPAAIRAAVLGYLRARFPLPPGATTPGEVHSRLQNSVWTWFRWKGWSSSSVIATRNASTSEAS